MKTPGEEKKLSLAWVDYQKAFDSVPHDCVEESIAFVGMNSKIVKWNTRLI